MQTFQRLRMKGTGPVSEVGGLSHSQSLLELDPLYYVTQLGDISSSGTSLKSASLNPLIELHSGPWLSDGLAPFHATKPCKADLPPVFSSNILPIISCSSGILSQLQVLACPTIQAQAECFSDV